jgi:hypothetical protein
VKPDLPRHVPPRPKVSRNFKIAREFEVDKSASFAARQLVQRLVKGCAGAGTAAVTAVFAIWDTENNLKCRFLYAAIGLGGSLAFISAWFWACRRADHECR